MNIDELHLKNFRGFEDHLFSFPHRFSLLVGDNGTGKTAILDALSIAAGSLFLASPPQIPGRGIREDEIRVVGQEHDRVFQLETPGPTRVSCTGQLNGENISWYRQRKGIGNRTDRVGARKLKKRAEQLFNEVAKGTDIVLPLVAYYGTGRLWLQKQDRSDSLPPSSRFLGYKDCLDPKSNEKIMVQWFKAMEWQTFQEGTEVPALSAVKNAMKTCMINWQDLRFAAKFGELVAYLDDGRILPVRFLSDGMRNMLGMIADIAQRAATLNPHLGEMAPLRTPGIVLIDEIDLHLHPTWQRTIVTALKRAFPKIQFVATSHSPFFIQSLEDGELINLDEREPYRYADASIEDITEEVMGIPVPQKSRRYLEMMEVAEEYYRVLDQARDGEADKLKHFESV